MASDTTLAQRIDESQPSPAADATFGTSFFAAHHIAAPRRPALTQEVDVDVCVIGAGLAGLTVAREVARKGWSVAVLESKRIAWNASGRNTGFVLPGFGQGADRIVDRVGLDAAKELWTLSQTGVDYVRQSIDEGRMRGIAPSDGWLHVSKTDRAAEISDDAELLRNLGADVEFWPAHLVRSKLKTESYFQAIHYPTALNIHPLNYALELARLAEEAGARIFEDTTAVSIDPAGVRKRVTTARGRVRAAHIVLAGNVHLGPLMPELSQTLLPLHTYVIATNPLGPQLAEAIEYHGSVSDTDRADNHYRIVDGDRLMWSGRVTTWNANPKRFAGGLRQDLRRRFPTINGVKVDYMWSGAFGLTVHRMPQIGEYMPHVWLASGFGGHGLNTTAMGGNLIAGAIVEGDDRWRLFEPFELVWAGGRAGRIAFQATYWGRRKYERWSGKLSQVNEKKRIRADLRAKRQAEAAAVAAERARIQAEIAAAERAKREAEAAEKARIDAEQALAAQAARIEAERIERERIAVEQAVAAVPEQTTTTSESDVVPVATQDDPAETVASDKSPGDEDRKSSRRRRHRRR